MALNYVTFGVHLSLKSRYEYNLSIEKEKEPHYVIPFQICYFLFLFLIG